jgi:hypothetical protein
MENGRLPAQAQRELLEVKIPRPELLPGAPALQTDAQDLKRGRVLTNLAGQPPVPERAPDHPVLKGEAVIEEALPPTGQVAVQAVHGHLPAGPVAAVHPAQVPDPVIQVAADPDRKDKRVKKVKMFSRGSLY